MRPVMDSWARRFFELSQELLLVLSSDGRILQANAAWSGVVGWEQEDLSDSRYPRFVHPADLAAVEAQLQALAGQDGRASFSCRWQSRDGAWQPLSWSVVASAEDGLLYCTARPLESPPAAAVPPMWSLDDSLPFGLYLREAHSGRVLYANQRFCQLAGIEAMAEAIRRGEACHAGVLQQCQSASQAELFRPGPGGPSTDGLEDTEVMLSNGLVVRRLSTPLRDLSGAITSYLYVFKDVTERRNTEEALQRSELGFRKLIESAPDGIFVHREGRFVYLNPSLLRALGYHESGELVGRPILEIVHPDDRELVRHRVSAVVDKGEVAPLREVRYLRKDGTWFDAESTGLPIEFDGRESVVVMARNITERKRTQAQLLQTDRMALVGTLAAGVGHEINNPLSYVMANLSLALESLEPLARESAEFRELEEMLQEAQEGATRVRNIVRDLKSFSRQDEERRTAVDVRQALDFSIKMASSELRLRAQLVKKYEPVPEVYADASRLGQVFLNLLINAAQAIPEGNTSSNHITVWVRQDASGRVAVDVSDTGAGIPPDVIARIFDPFFTTKPVGTGTGLGLSICHGIIRGLGGEISVSSQVGRGTTFTVLLPVATQVETSEPAPNRQLLRSARRGRVLVIDDEPGVGRSLARIIGTGHEVAVVQSGQEGLAKLGAEEPYDVIFCDLMMPDTTGMDVYERVRESRPELASRFIFITGGSYTARAREFLETVPNEWLEKPFELKQLHRLLGAFLGAA